MNQRAFRPDRYSVFSHFQADNAVLYRAILAIFTEAKSRFALHLRPPEILVQLEATHSSDLKSDWATAPSIERVESALHQLCQWGNLEANPDTTDVSTVEDFYRPRFLYQLTVEGEAAERAIGFYEDLLAQKGELQAAALGDLRELLGELQVQAESSEPDPGKVHRTLTTLRARFDDLTSRAQTFLASLQRTIDLQGIGVESFLAYKDRLIEYLERFIGELIIMTRDIAGQLHRIEALGIDRLLIMASARDLVDALAPSEEDHRAALETWRSRWSGLRAWFIRDQQTPSQAEVLRSHARAAIPALLGAVANINDRRATRSDRVSDLLTLARWFAESESSGEAHRLWRAAFALAPARHLKIDEETLAERDQSPVSARTSWLEAPPLLISPRLRKTGRYQRRGRARDVIDRSRDKRLLEEAAGAESDQIARAQRQLANGRRMRLSEVGRLDRLEFHLFLDLLGEALSRKVRMEEVVEATSSDGSLLVVLEPAGDEAFAVIETPEGRFAGPDHFITVHEVFESVASSHAAEKVASGRSGNGNLA